jgi:hypothetical protein
VPDLDLLVDGGRPLLERLLLVRLPPEADFEFLEDALLVARPRDPLRLEVPRELLELDARPRLEPRPEAAAAVSRDTSLLKLLFSPLAVVSCRINARPRSSNLSNQSSHEISSSESAPL